MSNAIEDPRVRAAIEHYLLDLENTQPKNTKRNYRPKQEEWKEWCQANWPAIPDVWPASVPQGQQLPGDLVDEGKLLLFMKEKTTPRGSGSQEGRERRRAPSDTIVVGGGGSEYESDSDLELYESTLKLQYNTVRGYVSAIQKLYDEQKSRESILRPGHGSGTEGAQTQHSCNDLEPEEEGIHGQGVGTLRDVYAPAQIPDHTNVAWSERREIACALRTQVDFLLGNHMLLRSGNRLPMELADCFPLDLPNEGFKAQGGKVSVFQRSEDWYETKVLRRSAKEPQAPLSGQTAREWTSRFYKKAGIKVSKIRRAGRWNNGDQMTGCYLTSLPFEFMRAVADFDPEWSGSYFVPGPPSPFSDLGVEQNMAAGAFLELLEWLREVLLQDAVFLRESYPDHPIFQDPVFSCPEFEAFASKVQDTCTRDHEDSHTTVIQKAIPVVAEKLRTLDEFAQATYTVTFSPGQGAAGQHAEIAGAHQQRRRAPRETVLRSEIGPSQAGGPTYAPLSLEQQQGMVQAGQGKPQGRAHGEPPGPREPPSFKLPVLSNLYRSCCVSGGRAGAKCLLWILLSETGVLDGGHLQRRITFPRARSSSMRFGGGPSRTA
ncbi:centromere DNA-binding protein complex CBF3 subunit [Hirsutella rhossiliensis]|uniref:Centromere DNA-binding protein complex CBF3 subunit n=1 Tax=Hirsutella rhossiliensis TaxID=111463 RepID=A0A9P8MVN5_9HYPO|nr:centromere DNA-binding protein complex CBF3 subunit [Hirsutella rhossiliensis]KAH0961882.1 centromere DNA-binding protein complex CBF3 subunit [Hirsutella rhossiliensis]